MGILPPHAMPRLVITKGLGTGRDHAVGTECVVGRAPEADFVLDDQSASRRHFRVSRDADRYVLEDLGSRNGTLLNGSRVQREGLADGDLIRAGATEMTFRQKDMLDGGAPAARPAIAVPPVAVVPPKISVPSTTPAEPKPADPSKKPLPPVKPTRRLRSW